MTNRPMRRWPLLATVLAFGGMVLLGALFWRTLPPMIPEAAFAARTSRPFAGVPPLPFALAPATIEGVTAAIIDEPENVRMTGPGQYARALAGWRALLVDAGVVITNADDADVLVVPQARCLGPVHRRLIARHLGRGRGVVTTGLTGANDGVCTPLADTLLAQLTGLRDADIRQAPQRKTEPPYVVVLGETVLGAGIPPGPRLDLTPANQVVFRARARDVLYADYSRTPLSAGEPGFDAAVVRTLVGPGRVVAFGYALDDLETEWSKRIGAVVAANAVRWAAGHHSFQLAAWPNDYKAAAVLAHDVEADYRNAQQALEALEPYDLPGTAFIVGSLAEADMETTRRLFAAMEIGTHTQRHLPLDTLSDSAQAAELANSKRTAERLLGRPVRGMRPPEERYTPWTLQVWADLGGDYVFANNNMRSAAPEVIPLLPDSLILLGRVSEDDYELLNRDRLRDREVMTRRIVSQIGESIAYRGLYMFSYHSHMFAQKELLPVLTSLAERLKETPEVWTTTAGEVASWWRARAALHVVPSADGQRSTVTNTGRNAVDRARIIIHAPSGAMRIVRLPAMVPGAAVVVGADGSIMAAPPAPAPAGSPPVLEQPEGA